MIESAPSLATSVGSDGASALAQGASMASMAMLAPTRQSRVTSVSDEVTLDNVSGPDMIQLTLNNSKDF
jgi:hypothetical protein